MTETKKIVYMDWNTLKGVKDFDREPFITIKNLLEKYKDKLIIPYSPSHLADLNKNYQRNKIKIDDDLEFLKSISQDNIIAKYFGINETKVETRDVIKFFHEIRKAKENENPVSEIFDNHIDEIGIDFKKIFGGLDIKSILPDKEELNKSESGKVVLKQFSSFFETGNFMDLLSNTSKLNEVFQNNPQEYNDLRKGLKEDLKLDSNISNWESVIQKLDLYLPNTLLGKSFSQSVIEDVNRFHKKPIFFDYYLSTYNQLGLFGFRPDNLNVKNRFNNAIEDGFHSFYGAHSNCFITNDKTLYHRSKVLFELFNIESELIKTFKVKDNSKFSDELENVLKNNKNSD